MNNLFNYGDLIMVRNSEDSLWFYAYFARFQNGAAYVFRNGASQFTQRTSDGDQPHELTEDELEGMGGIELAFPCDKFAFWQKPQHMALYRHNVASSGLSKLEMRRGDLVQVRYEENEPWKFAHIDSFGEDGRVRVMINGWTPFTELNAACYQQHHLNSEYDSTFNINIYNFWRFPTEITDSSDLRLTDQYRKQWCIPKQLETN
ncbi:hypothetical protein LMH73_011665 [Vibrio splendidus]|nr:hypothetical protein [Vibrio splendidus]MCC4883047.1 hypothetical protein [Vibrio splendidus]